MKTRENNARERRKDRKSKTDVDMRTQRDPAKRSLKGKISAERRHRDVVACSVGEGGEKERKKKTLLQKGNQAGQRLRP